MFKKLADELWRATANRVLAVVSFGLLMVLIGYVAFARAAAPVAAYWLIALLVFLWVIYVLIFTLQRIYAAYRRFAVRLARVQTDVNQLRQAYPPLVERLDQMQSNVERLLTLERLPVATPPVASLSPGAERSDDEITFLTAAERYGMAYDSLRVECILNDDGSALILREIKVAATSQFAELDTFLYAPDPTEAGEPWEIDPDFVKVSSLTAGWQIDVTEFKRESGRLSALLRIDPPLLSGQSMTYQMEQRLPRDFYTIYLDPGQFDPNEDNYDYWGWTINRPTRNLHLRIYLPPGNVKPQEHHLQVRYASASDFPAQRAQYEERSRANKVELKGPDGGRYILDLSVDYPVTGLIYILRWLPPFRSIPLPGIKPMMPASVSRDFPGIDSDLLLRIRDQLMTCAPFADERALKATFIDNRISPWRNDIPEGDTVKERAELVMAFLFSRTRGTGENGLVLFLRVLSERYSPGDSCGDTLARLADELEQSLNAGKDQA